ncbi:MAG: hypothetical protein H6741_11960 [Alphaproteobacteria bacterium]|nr:hypothetical protein [Alphaproteobacteria bacterium]MCB9793427.1 hypothetical protein [Alphaproteobacteria bacterium]
MDDLRNQLALLLADRHSAETRAFYLRLLSYIERRARTVWRSCYRDLLSAEEIEEVVADVLQKLMTKALARFRGETLGELFSFVRTVTDRCIWHRAQRVLRERAALEGEGAEEARSWQGRIAEPMALLEVVPDVPLNEADQSFLVDLLRAASKAEYARQHGVSRAAVTQRVQRIQGRISALAPKQQKAVDAWLQMAARGVLEE